MRDRGRQGLEPSSAAAPSTVRTPSRERTPSLALVPALAMALVLALGDPTWAPAHELGGQITGDVELMGRIHGTRPPEAYFQRLREDPAAFQFERAWTRGGLGAVEFRRGTDTPPSLAAPLRGIPTRLHRDLGFREGGVSGTFRFPVVLGLFDDSPGEPPVSRETLQRHFFDGPNPSGTVREYYAEASQGRVDVRGVTFPWERSALTGAEVAGGTSGLASPARIREYIVGLLEALDAAGMDWSPFVNDGSDGIPNSPDDDGFVDLLAVFHPAWGSECGSDPQRSRVWSHRYRLSAWGGGPYVTSTPAASGGFVRIDDYIIQPALSCDRSSPNEIGVLAHELGHGFGLPDLYGTHSSSNHFGAGNWDLMATGTWGCAGNNPARPCGMGAWTRAMLGWVEVEDVPAGTHPADLVVPPSLDAHRVYRLEGEGSDTHLLLENRQRDGFDAEIFSPGLLVWQVDPEVVATRWRSNSVNADPDRMGVWLRQADGEDRLTRPGGGRGDAGNPFPGATGNQRFHAGSSPSARDVAGRPLGVTLLDITRSGREVRLVGSTYSPRVRLEALGPQSRGFVVDQSLGSPDALHVFRSAPFQEHLLEVRSPRESSPGVRPRFLGWSDGSDLQRERPFLTPLLDTTLVANFGAEREFRMDLSVAGGAGPHIGGQLLVSPGSAGDVRDGWVAEGAEVSLEAVARVGFRFREWVGLEALPDPRVNPLVLEVHSPLQLTGIFEAAFAVSGPTGPVVLEAGREARLEFTAGPANPPVEWMLESGHLPQGLALRQAEGRLEGAPVEVGAFTVGVMGRDAIGLEDRLTVSLEVIRPQVTPEELALALLQDDVGLTPAQRTALDRLGNGNGRLDVGDLRIFLREGGGR